eukprot:TRINITY_DN71008_c0_g1_i1.p1 TRINITY_DN71008_c0_g1~~TRINITY_DN71008_c0_g1_i1.p1  ORF type:complete len:211 (+),score=51.32 TRINITY_DN71008_c0_g1_i1:91-633(+)
MSVQTAPNPAEQPFSTRTAPSSVAGRAAEGMDKRLNYHAFAFGNKVTGIGLRARIAKVAEGSAVHGWSQNLSDHTVEVVGNGPAGGVQHLSEFIRARPHVSRVAEQLQSTKSRGAYKHFFSIGHHGHATKVGGAWAFQADYVGDIPRSGLRHPPQTSKQCMVQGHPHRFHHHFVHVTHQR